jgi:ribosomal protein L31
MRKILITAAAGAALAITPALAAKPASKPEHPPKPAKCKVHSVGYNAKGTLVDASGLTQTKGADTTTKSDDRWSGDISVDVKKANHKVLTGQQTFTLTDARVKWYDADHNGTPDTPAAGDRVGLHGKVTRLGKKCDQTGFTATVTVKKVDFKKAKTPPTTAPTT